MNNSFFESIRNNPVQIGQTFKSYAELCRAINIPVTTGKQRQLDQRHLKCYFDWETKPGSHQLRITSTYYKDPKPFDDQRQGVHTTETGQMLQNLFLAHDWDSKYYFALSGFLYQMGLFSKEQQEMRTRVGEVERRYSSRLCGRLRSAITQINKKSLATVGLVVIDLDTREILHGGKREHFLRIKRETLQAFGVNSEAKIWWRRQYEDYEKQLSIRTKNELNIPHVNERYIVRGIMPLENPPPTREEFLTRFGQELVDGYRGGLGVASKEVFRDDLLCLFQKLNAESINLVV